MTRREGFTLLELIVVITIIGIMGTFVAVKVSGMGYKAQATKIQNDLQTIYKAAQAVEVQTGSWPQNIEECVNPPTDDIISGVLEEYPKDPWQNDYIYDLTDRGPVISCLGKDGADGGENEDQDYFYPKQSEY